MPNSAARDVFDRQRETEVSANDHSAVDTLGEEKVAPSAALDTDTDDSPKDASLEASTSGGAKGPDGATRAVSRSSKWGRPIMAAGALLLVSAVATSGYLGWQVKRHNDIASASRAALDTAREYAVILTSVDHDSIDENFAQVLDGATGEFRNMYSQSSAQLRQALIDNEAVSHGTVVDAAVKSATTREVEVLVFIDQSISNRINPEPRIDRSRISMTMQLIDGRWLASAVDIK